MFAAFRSYLTTALAVASIATCLHPRAFGRDATEVIVLKNGDRITGEVKRLQNGVLIVDLPYVDGSVRVDWMAVARLESKALFLIQLQDGSTYSASIVNPESLPGQPVMLEVRPVDNPPVVVERTEVVGMSQTSDSIWQRLSGSLTLGATYSKGNRATQDNIAGELDYQDTRWGARSSYTGNVSSSSGTDASTRNQVDLFIYRFLPWKNWFYAGMASLLQSSVQHIDSQDNTGFGVGRYLKNTNRVRLTVLGGVGWQRTRYSQEAEDLQSQNAGVVILATNLQVFSFKRARLDLDASVASAAKPEPGRSFSRLNMSYYLKLFGKIDWNLSFYGNWDTRPPAHLPGSDYGSSTGVSWTFGDK